MKVFQEIKHGDKKFMFGRTVSLTVKPIMLLTNLAIRALVNYYTIMKF